MRGRCEDLQGKVRHADGRGGAEPRPEPSRQGGGRGEEESPGEATHLAVTFRLTEARTGATGGRSRPLRSQRLRPLSKDT